ncbi:MAG: metalloregulator ArsR/SmtB family transcription factor [Actinobacteria bacterium]|jgi:rhodanese-related sulfurtransferase/predicted transcriptional regulator|nr:metalloregulator ArsR/SmtB family transcription factor [Actinomycetota bacterium]
MNNMKANNMKTCSIENAPAETIYRQCSRITKALSSPKRLQLLELIAQGGKNVEELAKAANTSVANASQHLQLLHNACLVRTRRQGNKIFYTLADEEVVAILNTLWRLAGKQLVEIEHVIGEYLNGKRFEAISQPELLERISSAQVTVIDVRPREEFWAGHIATAHSIPLDELETRLEELPDNTEVIAYCRGPYCLLADQAVELLRNKGFKARRLEGGMPEWKLAKLPAADGNSDNREIEKLKTNSKRTVHMIKSQVKE